MIYKGQEIVFENGGYTYSTANGITFETYSEAMQDIDLFYRDEDNILKAYGPNDEITGTH